MRAKILIVDDDPDIVLALENRVTWMGHEPMTASNGKDGLRAIQQEQPDLALVDIQLPGLSGIEILEQLQALSTKEGCGDPTAHIGPGSLLPPLIVLTAFGTI